MSNQNKDIYTAASYVKRDAKDNFYLSGLKCSKCNAIFLDQRTVCANCFSVNQFNEINTKGFLVKAIICSLVAYVIIRFIRV